MRLGKGWNVRRTIWLVPAMAAVVLAGALAFGGSFARGAVTVSRQVTFADQVNGRALRLQVEPSAPDAGGFAFRVPGRGIYVGTAGTSLRVLSQTNVAVQFQGPATLRPDTGPGSPPSGVSQPTAVTISLQATVDPTNHTGTAALVDGTDIFQLVALAVGVGDIGPTLQTVEAAFVRADWATLYGYMNSDVTGTNTPTAFASQMAQASAALGPITALRRVATGGVQANDQGVVYVAVTDDIDRSVPGGGTTTARYDMYYLQEGTTRKRWYTRVR